MELLLDTVALNAILQMKRKLVKALVLFLILPKNIRFIFQQSV